MGTAERNYAFVGRRRRMGAGLERTRVKKFAPRKGASIENKIKLVGLGKSGGLMKNRWMSYQPRKKHARSCTITVIRNCKDKITLIRDPNSNKVAFTRSSTLEGNCDSKDNRTLTRCSTLKVDCNSKDNSPFSRLAALKKKYAYIHSKEYQDKAKEKLAPLMGRGPVWKADAKYSEEFAQAALKYYNKRKGTCFVLVETLGCSICVSYAYHHINFTAKLPDCNFSKCFFAEVRLKAGMKKQVTACLILEGDPHSERMYCKVCKEGYVRHPIHGFRHGVVDE